MDNTRLVLHEKCVQASLAHAHKTVQQLQALEQTYSNLGLLYTSPSLEELLLHAGLLCTELVQLCLSLTHLSPQFLALRLALLQGVLQCLRRWKVGHVKCGSKVWR